MEQKILDHYLEFGAYTNPGSYKDVFAHDLPDDIRELGLLIRKNIIHRSTLKMGNTGTNSDLKFGDMTKVPWWRQSEDDVLVTVPAMMAELYRRDNRGLVSDRKVEDKIVVTCRFVAILMASILKARGIPARVRAGHAPYFFMGSIGEVSTDHWINQYWNKEQNRWVTIDVDGSLSLNDDFDPYDMPSGKFDFAADAWLDLRAGKIDPEHFYSAVGSRGAMIVLWSLFYDFHCLMNNEIQYIHGPKCGYGTRDKFSNLSDDEYRRIDDLAKLMKQPDENFAGLVDIWETQKDFRLLVGGLM